jgi:hypothetical protein
MIRVYQIKSQMFLIIVKISRIFIFFVASLLRINIMYLLRPLIGNSRITMFILNFFQKKKCSSSTNKTDVNMKHTMLIQ